jgi:hypothetical protein
LIFDLIFLSFVLIAFVASSLVMAKTVERISGGVTRRRRWTIAILASLLAVLAIATYSRASTILFTRFPPTLESRISRFRLERSGSQPADPLRATYQLIVTNNGAVPAFFDATQPADVDVEMLGEVIGTTEATLEFPGENGDIVVVDPGTSENPGGDSSANWDMGSTA